MGKGCDRLPAAPPIAAQGLEPFAARALGMTGGGALLLRPTVQPVAAWSDATGHPYVGSRLMGWLADADVLLGRRLVAC